MKQKEEREDLVIQVINVLTDLIIIDILLN